MTINLKNACSYNRSAASRIGWINKFNQICQILREETDWGAAYFLNSSPQEDDFATGIGEWQYRNGLSSDGKLGPATWRKLEGKTNFSGGIGSAPPWLRQTRRRSQGNQRGRDGVQVEYETTMIDLGAYAIHPRLMPVPKLAMRLHPFEGKLHLVAGSTNPQWELELPALIEENKDVVAGQIETAIIRDFTDLSPTVFLQFANAVWDKLIHGRNFSAADLMKEAFTSAIGGRFRIKDTPIGEIEGRASLDPLAWEYQFQLFPYPVIGVYFSTLNIEMWRSQEFTLDLSGLRPLSNLPNPRVYVSGDMRITLGVRQNFLSLLLKEICNRMIARGIAVEAATLFRTLISFSIRDVARFMLGRGMGYAGNAARFAGRVLFTGPGGILTAALILSAATTAISMGILHLAHRAGEEAGLKHRFNVGFVREIFGRTSTTGGLPHFAQAESKGKQFAQKMSSQLGRTVVRDSLIRLYGVSDPQLIIEKMMPDLVL
ncbi:MAG: hypothetical protein KDB00_18425 [Planctomycetales bacterium]|nr:hypothetical protein [Planctomycetales bacterium]